MPHGYPILLDVSDKRIVIVGGGPVGLRKAVKLTEAGANDVTVVAPKFVEGFPPSVQLVAETYKPVHLTGAALVFAATDSGPVNAAVVHEARRQNALASRADAEEGADFTTPAVMRQGAATVAVWADSAALSAFVRDGLRRKWDPRWTTMAEAMQTLRPFIIGSDLSATRRRELFRQLATEASMEKLAAGGLESLRDWIMTEIHGRDDSQRD